MVTSGNLRNKDYRDLYKDRNNIGNLLLIKGKEALVWWKQRQALDEDGLDFIKAIRLCLEEVLRKRLRLIYLAFHVLWGNLVEEDDTVMEVKGNII